MARVLSFERASHEDLDLMTLGVRRKLDLAGIKLSLAGWRALPIEARRALRDAEVTDAASVDAFVVTLRGAAAGADVALEAMPLGEPPWRAREVPGPVALRLSALGAAIDGGAWRALDDEGRYLLWKLAEKAREPERFEAAVKEILG